jgi:hypothetical protein
MAPPRRVFRTASLCAVLALGLVPAGCRKPGAPGPTRVGYVDLTALLPLHPAWSQRDSLTALIASAHQSHQHPIPPFQVPPEPSLPARAPESGVTPTAEREQMEALIRSRIDRDFAAVLAKIEREVTRFRETELATAERESRLAAEASAPAFQAKYRAVAERWANQIAPLLLESVGLRPRITDILLLTPDQREERAQRLAGLERRINSLVAARDAELAKLREEYLAQLQQARERRLTEAEADVARYREQRLGELLAGRERQLREIRADLERSLRLQVALPEILPPLPGPTAEAARRRAAATSASAVTTMDHYHEAARDIEHQLYVQREELEKMITAATQTAVLQIARTHRIDVHFAPPASGKNLTPEFAARLRERWAAGANGA